MQDWGPVLQEIKRAGAGMVMVDHWVASEYAAFCKQYIADPSPNTLVYLQYGPSQPEFLDLAGPAADGFVWSSVLGDLEKGMAQLFVQVQGGEHKIVYSDAIKETALIKAPWWSWCLILYPRLRGSNTVFIRHGPLQAGHPWGLRLKRRMTVFELRRSGQLMSTMKSAKSPNRFLPVMASRLIWGDGKFCATFCSA